MTFVDASAQAEAVRSGEVSPQELVEEAISKIEELNPRLNAVVSKRYERALEEAEDRDFSDKPFAGVPILLKDLGQEQAGEPSTSGSRLFKNYQAKESSNYTKAIEDLGFIVLGRSNTPEFGFKNISDSSLHGLVNLPYDTSRNAGGSSGGAAASLASNMVSIAPASDGGGSIRIPASFNGLIGLKPTRGRIPVGPSSFRGWQGASVNFALTKSIRDTKNLLYHFQISQLESPFPLPTLSRNDIFSDLKGPLRIAVLTKSPIGSSVSDEAKQATKDAALFLQQEGHQVEELTNYPFDGIEAMQSYYVMNSVETAAMFDDIETSIGRQMTADDMELMTWAIYKSGQSILAKDYSRIISQWDIYSHIMAQFHKKYDLILTPTAAGVAPKHGQFDLSERLKNDLFHMADFGQERQQELIWDMFAESLALTPFTQQANLTGQPSISLPTHRREDGLAIGIQLTAAKGREDLLLQVAQLFENQGKFM